MNAVIYARYSSHGQTEQSIEGQLHDAYAWADQQDVTVVGEYIDRALTGTKDARPDFLRMIADAAKHQFQMIIVWKLDRFARNRYDSAIYKAKLKKHGVRVVSVKENITDSPEGIILEGLLESMAEYYSANLSQNVKRGQRETIAKGRYCGGWIPYGYRSQDGKLVADEKTAPVLRYVFEQYASGVRKRDIIDALNRRGIRNSRGKPLSYSSFQDALKNRTYIGQFMFNGEVIPDIAEPLVSEEIFNQVQERMKSYTRAPAASKAKVEYLLQGKAFCGHCGAPMVGESGRSHTGTVHNYYACAQKKKHHTCSKMNERKVPLEQYVTEQTVAWVLAPDSARRIAARVAEEYRKEFTGPRITELQRAIAQLDAEMEKLIDAIITTPPSAHKAINARMESIGAQKEDLQADLTRLQIARGIQITEPEILAWLKHICIGSPEDPSFQRKIIDTLVNSVYISDDRITIFYNLYSPSSTSPSSNLESIGRAIAIKSEPVFIFINGHFGFIFQRTKKR